MDMPFNKSNDKILFTGFIFILVSPKNVPCINLSLNIIQTSIVAVGDDSMALCLKCNKIVHHTATEKSTSIF